MFSSIPFFFDKTIVFLCFLIVLHVLAGCSSSLPRSSPRPVLPRDENNPPIKRHQALVEIMSLMRTPYDLSGTDSTGIDCSGFTAKIYRDVVGGTLPHSAREQFELGTPIDRHEIIFGDLVFFNTTGETASHVGFYVGDGLFAHASFSLGVTISILASTYYSDRYVGARRIVR